MGERVRVMKLVSQLILASQIGEAVPTAIQFHLP
jgi:hypothetical protein